MKRREWLKIVVGGAVALALPSFASSSAVNTPTSELDSVGLRRAVLRIKNAVCDTYQTVIIDHPYLNDDLARQEVKLNMIATLDNLKLIVSRYKVICDATNNPPAVIEAGRPVVTVACEVQANGMNTLVLFTLG